MGRADVDGACVVDGTHAGAIPAGRRRRHDRVWWSAASGPVQPGVLSTMMRTTMRHAPRFASTIAAALAAIGSMLACSDVHAPSAGSPVQPVGARPVTTVAQLRATVDVATGT